MKSNPARMLSRLIVLLIWLSPVSVLADVHGSETMPNSEADQNAMSRLVGYTANLQQTRANFDQQVIDENGRIAEQTEGSMMLLAPVYFRWDYLGDFPQVIVADGQRIWHYDIELEQITVKSQAEAISRSPLSALMQPELLVEQYRAQELFSEEGLEVIRLHSRAEQAEVNRIDLRFVDAVLTGLEIEDGFGQVTMIQFSNIVSDTGLSPADFLFVPPEGVDVLGIDDLSPAALGQGSESP